MQGFNIEYKLVETPIIDPIFPASTSLSTGSISFGNFSQKVIFPSNLRPRASTSIFAKNGLIYIWGGYQFMVKDSNPDLKMWTYDPKLNSFSNPLPTLTPSPPPVRYGAPMTILEDIYLIIYGGVNYPKPGIKFFLIDTTRPGKVVLLDPLTMN